MKSARKPRKSLSSAAAREQARGDSRAVRGLRAVSSHALALRAESRVRLFLSRARAAPSLFRLVPGPEAWFVDVRLIGSAAMRELNLAYRRKDYATDILSFPAPEVFRKGRGILGELVLCVPVLKRQAREQGHTPERELDVLLVHGILHLLGFDHEQGPRAAALMARWEARLLGVSTGLIARSRSGT